MLRTHSVHACVVCASCALCVVFAALCSACMKNKQGSYYLLMTRLRVLEKETTHLEEICMSCCGVRKKGEEGIKCASLDCEVRHDTRHDQ